MEGESNVEPNSSVKRCARAADEAIAALAERQHGVIGRSQLADLGLERWEIWHRLQVGRLHAVHRGVYAVGHPLLSRQARWMAAVLALGGDGVLSHRSAAALWGLRPSAAARLEVTTKRRLRSRASITVHQAPLPADEVAVQRAIPLTTVPRTLLDLATVLDKRQVGRAIEEADRRRLDDPLSLRDLVERYPGRNGVATIRAILETAIIGSTATRSELEERFLAFVRAASLPSPELNVPLELRPGQWIEADCVWRAQRLIVELDGHATHRTAAAYERDRARDRALNAAGWRVVRVTWRQLHGEPGRLEADLRTLLQTEPR